MKVTVDGRPVEVSEGSTLLDAVHVVEGVLLMGIQHGDHLHQRRATVSATPPQKGETPDDRSEA